MADWDDFQQQQATAQTQQIKDTSWLGFSFHELPAFVQRMLTDPARPPMTEDSKRAEMYTVYNYIWGQYIQTAEFLQKPWRRLPTTLDRLDRRVQQGILDYLGQEAENYAAGLKRRVAARDNSWVMVFVPYGGPGISRQDVITASGRSRTRVSAALADAVDAGLLRWEERPGQGTPQKLYWSVSEEDQ